MFNMRRKGQEKQDNNKSFKSDFAGFVDKKSEMKNEFMNDLIGENKFAEKEAQMRAMVESMLEKEFSRDIKNIKSYNILVDAVINKLKKDELGDCEDISFND